MALSIYAVWTAMVVKITTVWLGFWNFVFFVVGLIRIFKTLIEWLHAFLSLLLGLCSFFLVLVPFFLSCFFFVSCWFVLDCFRVVLYQFTDVLFVYLRRFKSRWFSSFRNTCIFAVNVFRFVCEFFVVWFYFCEYSRFLLIYSLFFSLLICSLCVLSSALELSKSGSS